MTVLGLRFAEMLELCKPEDVLSAVRWARDNSSRIASFHENAGDRFHRCVEQSGYFSLNLLCKRLSTMNSDRSRRETASDLPDGRHRRLSLRIDEEAV